MILLLKNNKIQLKKINEKMKDLFMRPQIICHMMSSVDGRIVGNGWTRPYDGTDYETVIGCYFDISNDMGADAEWLGRKTVQTDLVPDTFDHGDSPKANHFDTFFGTRETARMCIVMDPNGKIRYSSDRIMDENIIVILGESVSQSYLEHLRELGISYLFAGKDGNDLNRALKTLGTFGIKKIMLQGGGIINGSFLNAGLIDELSLLIYPGIDGLAGIPGVFEYFSDNGERPAKDQSLELLSMKMLQYGVAWLRYRIHPSPSK